MLTQTDFMKASATDIIVLLRVALKCSQVGTGTERCIKLQEWVHDIVP